MAKPTISGYCFDYYACFGRSLHFDYIRKKELQTAYKAIKRVDTKIEKQRGKTMPYLIKAEQKFPYYYAKTGEFFGSMMLGQKYFAPLISFN